jgi:hypothetical protein
MYEIQGVSFTTEEIQSAADKYNMTFDDYLKAMQPKGIKQVENVVQNSRQKPADMSVDQAREYLENKGISIFGTPDQQLQAKYRDQLVSKEGRQELFGIDLNKNLGQRIQNAEYLATLEKEKRGFVKAPEDKGFFEDLVTQAEIGGVTGSSVSEALDIYKYGGDITDKKLDAYIEAAAKMEAIGPTNEQYEFQKAQTKYGGGIFGTLKALNENPGFFPQLIVSSLATMASSFVDSGDVAGISLASAGIGTAAGFGVGSLGYSFGPLGVLTQAGGAITGGLSGAIGGLVGAMETGLTLTDLLKTELEGKEFNRENIRDILEDADAVERIKNASLKRGLTIGAVEGLTAGLSRGLASGLKKAGVSTATITGTAGAVEMTGGGAGEFGGQIATREFTGPVDLGEVTLEAVAEVRGVANVSDIVLRSLKKSQYSVNGEKRTKQEIKDIVESKNIKADELAKIKFSITNDQNFSNFVKEKQNDAILETQINERVSDINDRKQLVSLEKQRIQADIDSKKTGIQKIPGSEQRLQTITAQINAIVDKYSSVDARTSDVRARKKSALEVREVVADRVFKAKIDFAKKHSSLYNLKLNDKLTRQEILEKYGEEAANSNGFIEGNEIIINTEVAKTTGIEGANVGNHELLHGILKSSGVNIKENLITDFLNIIGKNNEAVIQQRIDDNYTAEYMKNNLDEYFTIFSDAIETGDIKFNDSIFTKVKDIVRRLFQDLGVVKVNFDNIDARGMYNFLKDYNRSIHKGALSSGIVKGTKGEGAIEGIKLSKTIGDQIKALVPPGTTKQQYDSQVIGDVYNDLVVGDRLNGIIRGQLNRFGVTGDNVFGKPINNFVEDVKQQLFERSLTRFNPETNNDLGGFVVSELQQFRIGDVVNRYRREQAGSLDVQAGETGSIRTPVADEVVDVETTEAPRSELKQGLRVDGEQFVDQKLEDEIEANTIEIVEGVTPETNDKDFKTFVKDAAQQKSFKSVKNKLKNFEKFLEDNIDVLFSSNNLPIATLVAMERRTPAANRIFTGEPTRLTTQAQIDKAIDEGDFYVENERQGPSKYPRKKPTIQEVKKFFFDVGASTKGTRKDGLVNAISFSLFRDIVPGVMNRADIVQEDIAKVSAKLVVDPTIKFSKTVESNVQDILMLLNKYQRNEQDLTDQEKQIVEDYIGKIAIEEADKGKSAQQFTKSIKNSNLTDELKKGDWTLSDKKFKENEQALNKFEKNANDVASQIFIPNDIKNKHKNVLLGLFAGHYNIVGSEMAKVNSSFKQGILNSLNDSETSILSEKTLNRWKNFNWNNLKSSYSYENITALKNIKNANSLSEQRKIANESFNTEEGKAQLELYDLWNTTLAEWLHSSDVNSKEFNDKADYILKLKKANSSIGTTGERILSPPGYVYLPGQTFTGTIKFEHLKSSSQQSEESAILVLNNKWKDQGKKGLKAYNGIFGLLDDFNIVDKQTGKVNDSNIFRFAENLELAKNIYSVESGFKQTLYDDIVKSVGKKAVKEFESDQKAIYKNNIKSYPKQIKYSKSESNEKLLNDLNNYDQALRNARNLNAPKKGISIFDFDDTLATSKSKVIVTVDGKTTKITPAEFAKQHSKLEQQGAKFDFSEFNKVIDGKPGPRAAKIKKAIDKFGNKDVFVLTARPQASAVSIKAFLDGIGVNIPLENITGLEDGTPQAKANWVTGKAAEGYNDFYFTDDVYKNVKAVQDALEVLDVKSKTRLAYSDRVKKLDRDFNDIIEAKTGIAAEKEYGRAKAAVVGANKGKFTFFIPPSAEDFVGLLYNTLSKGKLGDSQMAWYKKNLIDPFASAMAAISRERIALMDDYKALKKQLGIVPKNLRKKIPGETFTNEQAVRVYIWNKQGMTVPGLSKADLKELTDYIENNTELKLFSDQLIAINKAEGYTEPTSSWLAGTITTDIMRGLGTTKRAKHLQQWQQNVDIIFSEKNLNKLEAANGKAYRVALESILQRMKTGRNRAFTGDSITGKVTDWLTNSIGTIMFFNTRSALLQTISAVNFVNFTDNNIFKAGKAYANQKQFWKDFMQLMNSEFLVDRRRGLRINVNEADIANMANEGGARGVISKLLEFGFLPTQIADSFAIASGGATFYRNRINTYKKQGLSDQQAQEQAFNDFREIAEESQQSSRPDRISQQQAGPLGRIILAFANTPMQYARLIKKAASDLKNRRGDVKTNISKIIYYGFVQNLIFNALQQAIFAIGFGNIEEEEDEKDKYINTANGMLDSLLRGIGIAGAFVSVGKNIINRVIKESQKDNPKYEKITADFARISPPISSKLSRLGQAGRAFQWEKEEMREKGFAIDNPALMAGANVISAATNIPIDRLVRKANNVNTAVSQDLELWERFALLGGWQDWELGIDDEPEKSKEKTKFGETRQTRKRITRKRIN